MKYIEVPRSKLVLSPELSRTSSAKSFEERLMASIEEIGLAEPIKVAPRPDGTYLVVDGTIRLKAIDAIRERDNSRFKNIAAYVVDFDRRFELRYQTDIYQDLLPSQMAALIEHLHEVEDINKVDIGRFIGVSGPTIRNYTGLWRMIQRGGLLKQLVELMDVGVLPCSNPYAWLRLNDEGVRKVLEDTFTEDEQAEAWIEERIQRARRGDVAPIARKLIDAATDSLASEYYREDEEVRVLKRGLGLRRSQPQKLALVAKDKLAALKRLQCVSDASAEPVLVVAAAALGEYIDR